MSEMFWGRQRGRARSLLPQKRLIQYFYAHRKYVTLNRRSDGWHRAGTAVRLPVCANH